MFYSLFNPSINQSIFIHLIMMMMMIITMIISQIKLVRWDNRHKEITAKLQAWVADKEAYLNTKEHITSVGAAQYELSRLDAYDAESKQVEGTTFSSLRKLGDDLEGEKFESLSATRSREHEIADAFVRLGQLSNKKRPVLDDDLAREQFRDDLRLQNQEHIDIHANLEVTFTLPSHLSHEFMNEPHILTI